MENQPKLPPDVMTTVENQFAPEDRREATELLATYGQRSSERDTEAVQKAILKLANGELERLKRLVDLAKGDYRDVLAWATERIKHKPIR